MCVQTAIVGRKKVARRKQVMGENNNERKLEVVVNERQRAKTK